MGLISCEKENTRIEETALPVSVRHFTAEYSSGNIDLSWSYSYTGDINYYILYYSPGGEDTDTINPYESFYRVDQAMKDTNYLFNIRVVDKKGNYSVSEIARVSTY
jgi:hypothetical protein